MRHGGAGEGGQDAGLAAHRLVAVGPLVRRRPAQDVLAGAAAEPQQHVLRPTGDQLHVGQRTGAEAALVHPRDEAVEIDDGPVERQRHVQRGAMSRSNSSRKRS